MKTSSHSPILCLSFPSHLEEELVFGLGGVPGNMVPLSRPSGGLRTTHPPPQRVPDCSRSVQGVEEERGHSPGSSLSSRVSSKPSPHILPPHQNAPSSISSSEAKSMALNSPQPPSAGEPVAQRDHVTLPKSNSKSRRVRTQSQHQSH